MKRIILFILLFISMGTLWACTETEFNQDLITVSVVDGTSITTFKVVKDIEVSNFEKLTEPKKEGYDFKGFYLDSEYIYEFEFPFTPTEDFSIYIKWEIKKFTITWKDDNGNVLALDEFVDYKSFPVFSGLIPTKEGYTFIGWSPELSSVTDDQTYVATYQSNTIVNTYKVSFYDYDKTLLKEVIVNDGDGAEAPYAPSNLEGYHFVSWDKDFSNVTSDLEINAVYEINYYTVTFYDRYYNILSEQQVKHGKSAIAPNVLPSVDYTFLGWNENYSIVTCDLEITMNYSINIYSVKFFDFDNTLLKEEFVSYGDSANAPQVPNKEGYEFLGWDKDFNCITSNLSVTAIYRYGLLSVIWKNYDGSILEIDNDVALGTIPSYDGITPTKEATEDLVFKFIGWSPAVMPVEKSVEYVAVFSDSAREYNVVFKDYDGTVLKEELVAYNQKATAPEEPSNNEGYHFVGWSIAFDKIKSDLVVIALYEINIYSVKFYDYDGTLLKNDLVGYKKSATAPDNPDNKVSYYFYSWDKAFDYVTEDLEIWAVYKFVLSYEILDGYIMITAIPDHLKLIEKIHIPDFIDGIEVRFIGSNAFEACSELKEIVLPQGITKIYENAFAYCLNLKSINIPENVNTIGYNAFTYCESLESIKIPAGVTSISLGTFAGCLRLETILLPKNLKNINTNAFNNCASLMTIQIPTGVESIADNAFDGCSNLVSITIPDSVLNLGTRVFNNCTRLETVTLSRNIKIINSYLFYRCESLKSIIIPSGILSIEDNAFNSCTGLSSVTIPTSVLEIKTLAFSGCTSLKSVSIPKSIRSVETAVFRGCYNLESLTIPFVGQSRSAEDSFAHLGFIFGKTSFPETYWTENYYIPKKLTEVIISDATKIGNRAFSGCISLETIYIPKTVTTIGEIVFFSCPKLTIHAEVASKPLGWGGIGWNYYRPVLWNFQALMFEDEFELLLTCDNEIEILKYDNSLGLKEVVIPDTINGYPVVKIYDSVFKDCTNLEVITISDNLRIIGEYAFDNCTSLIEIKLPRSLISIGKYAFYGCENLSSVVFEEESKLAIIDSLAFGSCINLSSIEVPINVEMIGDSAFYRCYNLEKITLPFVGYSETGDYEAPFGVIFGRDQYENSYFTYTYYIPTKLKEVVILRDTTIGTQAFYKCEGLSKITILSGTINIESLAFVECSGLTSLILPDTLTSIGDYAFSHCRSLTELSFEANTQLKSIGLNAFQACSSITTLILPNNIEVIGHGAFIGLSSLESIVLPFIGETFNGTSNNYFSYIFGDQETFSSRVPVSLKTITLTKEENLAAHAFYNCRYIEQINLPETLISIGDEAFRECRELSSILFPVSLTRIGDYAFTSCSKLNGEIVFENVTSIGNYAFNNCGNIVDVIVKNKAVSIGEKAFFQCAKLESFTSLGGVTEIQKYAFDRCATLKKITILNSITSINDYAFNRCSGLEEVTLANGLSYLGLFAFYQCVSLKSIIIPDGLTSIEASAFYGCTSLTNVTFPDGLTSIGDNSFYECSSLVEVLLPDSVTEVGVWAFYKCNSLTSLSISSGLTTLREFVFSGCSSLLAIEIPANITSLERNAFSGCASITDLVIPDTLTSIGDACFYDAVSLTNLTLSFTWDEIFSRTSGIKSIIGSANNLKTVTITGGDVIPDYAFKELRSIEEVILLDTIESIGFEAFYNCSKLSKINFPEGLKTINGSAFRNCSELVNVVFPDTLESIYESAFLSCSKLQEIILPAGLTGIFQAAFAHCYGLTEIIIPNEVTWVGQYAFNGCSKLMVYVVKLEAATEWYPDWNVGTRAVVWNHKETITKNDFKYSLTNDNQLEVIDYFNDSSITTISIPSMVDGYPVVAINQKAFMNSAELISVTVPNGITRIGSNAFSGCSGLTSIVIPNSVLTISSSAFYGCIALESMTLPFVGESRTGTSFSGYFGYIFGRTSYTGSYGANGYYIPSELKEVIITDAININDNAFLRCSSLLEISLSDTVENIYNSAFEGCSGLTQITIPMNVKTIGKQVFEGCINLTDIKVAEESPYLCIVDHVIYSSDMSELVSYLLTNVESEFVIPESITVIREFAFYGRDDLTSIILPENLLTIGQSAFYGCSGLTSVVIPANVISIESNAFYNCNGLTSLTIPGNVTSVGSYAFYGCSGVESIVLLEGITTIGEHAFQGCSKVTTLVVPNSVISIGLGAFNKCSNLVSITLPFIGAELNGEVDTHFAHIFGMAFSGTNENHIPSGLKTVIITNTTFIGYNAFYNCSGLTSIILPNNLLKIEMNAFYGCSSLVTMTLPDTVMSIGAHAFSRCTSLASITIPKSVETIDYGVFNDCPHLTVYVEIATIPDGWSHQWVPWDTPVVWDYKNQLL